MDRRTRLHKILTKIETQLQALIEGSTLRLLPHNENDFSLPRQIITAMESAIYQDQHGDSIAPDLFTIYVHPIVESTLSANQTLLDELAEIIHLSGIEAGFIFYSQPSIRIKSDPDLKEHKIIIMPEIRSGKIDKTSTVLVNLEGADDSNSPSAFLLVDGNHVYSLTEPVVNIGRRVDNHLVIDDKRVSRLHAQLRLINEKFVIFDLDSTSGTFVNNRLVKQHTLESGDVISLAGVQLVFGQDEYISHEFTGDSTESKLGSTRPLHPLTEDENQNSSR